MQTNEILNWIHIQNKKVSVDLKTISFDKLDKWKFEYGKLVHYSGKFFCVEGIRIKTNYGSLREWDQPIINQPEIGFLGIITKEIGDTTYFLLQAKIEPGNVNFVQLSPTLQATKSNYTQVHKGRKPLYIDIFLDAKPNQIIVDQLQSEQGSRFFQKRNRNIIIKIDKNIPIYDNFIWVTLDQIKHLMRHNNIINMDTRTVISTLPLKFLNKISKSYKTTNYYQVNSDFFRSANNQVDSINSLTKIISFLTEKKCKYCLNIEKIPLSKMRNWNVGEKSIRKKEGGIFEVIAVDVQIDNREIIKWSQPMISPTNVELSAFIVKEFNGVFHFAVQTILECGNFDKVEFAPTVQYVMSDISEDISSVPFLDYVLNAKASNKYYDTIQSEEGEILQGTK